MRIIEIESKNIKIVYKPAEDKLAIGDFVDVTEGATTLTAQVFKLYSDDNSSEYNYADINILLTRKYSKTSTWNGEVVSAEAIVKKTSWDFIENYINNSDFEDIFAIGYCSGTYNQPLRLSFKNFLTPAFVGYEDFSDNISFLNSLTYQLQKYDKKLLVIDYNGNMEIAGAKRVMAGFEQKLPLNSSALEKLSSKMTDGVSVESRAVIEEVLFDLASFARETGDFISITKLIDVINDTYKKTKIAQLILLKNKLRAYQKQNVFADLLRETQLVQTALAHNNTVVFDISNVQKEWQNEFLSSVILSDENCEKDFYLYLNIEQSLDNNLLRYLLFKASKSGVKPVLGANYRYVAMDTILDFCPNSFLFQAADGLDKRGYLSDILKSLAKDYFVVIGKLTSSLAITSYLGEPIDNLDEKTILEKNIETNEALDIIQSNIDVEDVPAEPPVTNVDMDAINTAIASMEEQTEEIKLSDLAENVEVEPIQNEQDLDKEPASEKVQLQEKQVLEEVPADIDIQDDIPVDKNAEEVYLQTQQVEHVELQEDIQTSDEPAVQQDISVMTELPNEPEQIKLQPLPEEHELIEKNDVLNLNEKTPLDGTDTTDVEQVVEFVPEDNEEIEDILAVDDNQEEQPVELQDPPEEELLDGIDVLDEEFEESAELPQEVGDDDLDFLEVADAQEQSYTQNDEDELLDLLSDEEDVPADDNVNIDDIDFDEEGYEQSPAETRHSQPVQEQKLPVYDADYEKKPKNSNSLNLQEGDLVKHNKYGLGTVKKLMNHGNKVMCSINFEDFGRRLLDPEISQLEKIQ